MNKQIDFQFATGNNKMGIRDGADEAPEFKMFGDSFQIKIQKLYYFVEF